MSVGRLIEIEYEGVFMKWLEAEKKVKTHYYNWYFTTFLKKESFRLFIMIDSTALQGIYTKTNLILQKLL